MKIEDIQDRELQTWAASYVAEKASDAKQGRFSIAHLVEIWKSYSEQDWRAFRELLRLRPLADEKFGRNEVTSALSRYLGKLPPTYANGIRYGGAYTLEHEARCLRELLGEPEPRRVKIEMVDFNP